MVYGEIRISSNPPTEKKRKRKIINVHTVK